MTDGAAPRGLARRGCLVSAALTAFLAVLFVVFPTGRHAKWSDAQAATALVVLAAIPIAWVTTVILAALDLARRRDRLFALFALGATGLCALVGAVLVWATLKGFGSFR